MKEWSFIIVAGGSGQRFGGFLKQVLDLGGMPLWEWSAKVALSLAGDGVKEVIVVVPEGLEKCFDVSLYSGKRSLVLVQGAETRQGSVLSGIRASTCNMVLVHDAARPFVSGVLCKRVMAEAEIKGAAVPLVPVSDAVKVIENGAIAGQAERQNLRTAQTPQAYPRLELQEVLEKCENNVDDESQAWVGSGRDIGVINGDPVNFKITYPEDLERARIIEKGYSVECSGLGYDIHPLWPSLPLILGGVSVPSRLGLRGHSDGDLLSHAISDALLGASGLPDIGIIFPSTDPAYRGACSRELLAEVVRMIGEKGFSVVSVDAVLNAQIPSLSPWIEKMKKSLEPVLFKSGRGSLSIKAKSGEGVGRIGNGEAMACWAFARVRKIGCPSLNPCNGRGEQI